MCGDGVELIARTLAPKVPVKEDEFIGGNAAVTPPAMEPERQGDLLVIRGNILTMAAGKFSPAEAFAIRGDTVVAVGTYQEVRAALGGTSVKETLDYADKFILPGFIDPHVHLIMTALVSDESHLLDFTYPRVGTRDAALERIKSAAGSREEGKWIAGYGYDPSLVDGHPDLTRTMLDDASGGRNPVLILNQSGHVVYLNTAGFAAAGLGINPGDPGYPADPNYEKDGEGRLTGLVFEDAVTTVVGLLPKPSAEKTVSGATAVLRDWASRGITTAFDCGIGHLNGLSDLDLLRQATAGADLPRFRGAIALQAIQHLIPELKYLRPPPWHLDNVQVYGIKFWLDGSTQGFTASLNESYLNRPQEYGILNFRKEKPAGAAKDGPDEPDDDKLVSLVQPFVAAGWQIVMHTNGARALDQALRVYARVFASTAAGVVGAPSRRRWMHRLEHVTADVSAAQLARVAQLGLAASHLIAHVRKWGRTFAEYVLGRGRAARLDPVRDCARAGVVYSFHSDSPISRAEPLQYVETATTRVADDGAGGSGGGGVAEELPVLVDGEEEDQRISAEEAFAGITYNPAKQIGALDELGSIEWGKKADFVVLDRDPREAEGKPGCIVSTAICETWIGGRRVYEAAGTR